MITHKSLPHYSVYIHGNVRLSGSQGAACLKIHNAAGEELSMAFDDSCGKAPHLSRIGCMMFGADDQAQGGELPIYDAEDFVQAIAQHLGYALIKK